MAGFACLFTDTHRQVAPLGVAATLAVGGLLSLTHPAPASRPDAQGEARKLA